MVQYNFNNNYNVVYYRPKDVFATEDNLNFLIQAQDFYKKTYHDLISTNHLYNYNNYLLDDILNRTRDAAIAIYKIFGIESEFNENSQMESIRRLNEEIDKQVYQTGDQSYLFYFKDFFYSYVIGFQGESNGLRRRITNWLKRILDVINSAARDYAKTDWKNYGGPFTLSSFIKEIYGKAGQEQKEIYSGDIISEINKTLDEWKVYLPRSNKFIKYLRESEDLPLSKNKQKLFNIAGNSNMLDFLTIENVKASSKRKGSFYYQINMGKAFVKFLANIMYFMLLQMADLYCEEKKKKLPKDFDKALKTFLRDNKISGNFISEFMKAISDYGFTKLISIPNFTGMYGEAVTAALLKNANLDKVIQIGDNPVYSQRKNNKKTQPPADLIIEKNEKKIRLQIKEWSSTFRENHGLGRKKFDFIHPSGSEGYYYSKNELGNNGIFSKIRFLIANGSLIDDNELKNLASAPYLFAHLIPGFLRIQTYVDFINKNVNGNDLFLISGYYVPAFFFMQIIVYLFKNYSMYTNEKLIDLRFKAEPESEDRIQQRRDDYADLLKKEKTKSSKKKDKNPESVINNAFAKYQSKNLVSSFKGHGYVYFSGINISDEILKRFSL